MDGHTEPGPDARLRRVRDEYDAFKARGFRLDIARGRPSQEQLDLSNAMLALPGNGDYHTQAGEDARNYGGGPQGLPELRALVSEMMGAPPERIVAGGNSSMAMMHDCVVWALLKGVPGSAEPWSRAGEIGFICPAPGYEKHHDICAEFGIRLLPVPVRPTGPDMDAVEALARDPLVKGMWCVPTYANPTGEVYADDTVRRLAAMPTGAPDFRLFWDDAYAVHHLTDDAVRAANILDACEMAGHPDRALVFASTSKITFAQAGVAFLAASAANIDWFLRRASRKGGGPDKLNQLRHVRFLQDAAGLRRHMAAHRRLLAPRFEAVLHALDRRFGRAGPVTWSVPAGGYFISVEAVPGTAKRVVALAADAGVVLTVAGSTWPGGHDPADSNIRLAPSNASLADVQVAAEAIALCLELASLELASLELATVRTA